MTRRRRQRIDDPLLRACTACGAGAGDNCRTVIVDGKTLTRIPIATRLVHADRLAQGATHA